MGNRARTIPDRRSAICIHNAGSGARPREAGGTRAECACAPDRARDGGGGLKKGRALFPVVARETNVSRYRKGSYGGASCKGRSRKLGRISCATWSRR